MIPATKGLESLFLGDTPTVRFTKKRWFGQPIPAEVLQQIVDHPESVWYHHKMVLLHQSCPDSITERFLESPVWYERLTAGLAKHKRAKYVKRLYSDIKSTVRAAAYKTAIAKELDDTTVVAKRILADKWVHGYFYSSWDLKYVKMFAEGLTADQVVDACNLDYDREQEASAQQLEDFKALERFRLEGIVTGTTEIFTLDPKARNEA